MTLDLAKLTTGASRWATESLLPESFRPMLPTNAAGPLNDGERRYELRWDGLRVLAGCEGRALVARNGAGQDVTGWFPELRMLRAAADPEWVLLDGELVSFEGERPDPARLRERLQMTDPAAIARMAESAPVRFLVSDILRIGDAWLLDVAWEDRHEILETALYANRLAAPVEVFSDGEQAWRSARALGLDGVIGKRLRGRYYPGERTRDWLCIRPTETTTALIAGWVEGRGARRGQVGSVVLAMPGGDGLEFAGQATVPGGPEARALLERLESLERAGCPFTAVPAVTGSVKWVQPTTLCRVQYQGCAPSGALRSAVFAELAGAMAERLLNAR